MTQLMLAAPGDTWGISGPTFLGLYWILTAVTIVVVLITRRVIREQVRAAGSSTRLDDDPYLVAYLHGGPHLALTAALAALSTDGLVECRDKRCKRTEAPAQENRPGLERQLLIEMSSLVSTTSTTRSSLAGRAGVAGVMMRLHDDLVQRRLLLNGRQHDRYRYSGWPLTALCLLGIIRLIAGAVTGRPVTYLAVSVVVVVLLTLLIIKNGPPRRTVLGDKELARLREEHDHLAPVHRPDWTANGATAAALAVGVFGASALYAAQPALAGELVAFKASSMFGGGSYSGGTSLWSGGSYGGSCGGSSGCSGGSGGGCGGGGGGGGGCGG